ncbi:MAG TPA: hypothetical protein VFU29_02840 [Chitinophagaceae bacterium]|nr:hypothetical protein [Chitinophagaceae bacterium]
MFFLLIVQKKEQKKSASTIVVICFFDRYSTNLVLDRIEFASAFFFVFPGSQTILITANEKDSAVRDLVYHAATTSPYHFDN